MLTIPYQQSYAITVAQLHQQLPIAGLDVTISFQMTGAALSHLCGTEECRCGMAVLLVYGGEPQPAILWVRGQLGRSWVAVDESLGYRVSAEFERRLSQALQA